jgi:hypothetical protein
MAIFHTHAGSARRFFTSKAGDCRLCRQAAEEIAAAMPALTFEPELTSSTGGDVNYVGNEKAMQRWLRTEAVRQTRTIVLNWTSTDGQESGRAVIGVNNEANRAKAAQLQQAAGKKGFKAIFSLVQA